MLSMICLNIRLDLRHSTLSSVQVQLNSMQCSASRKGSVHNALGCTALQYAHLRLRFAASQGNAGRMAQNESFDGHTCGSVN